jgi:hypothetical protein
MSERQPATNRYGKEAITTRLSGGAQRLALRLR